MTRRRSCARTMKTYRTRKRIVATVKKSIDANCPTWLRRNVIQVWVGFLSLGINRETVRSEISNPSLSNPPWMRGAPQMGLAAAMVRTNLRISKYTRGRPGPFDWDNLHQYLISEAFATQCWTTSPDQPCA